MADSQGRPGPALNTSFSLIASLLNGMPALFWATDENLILTAVSGGAMLEEGRPPNRYVGMSVHALFQTPDTRRRAAEAHFTVLAGGRCSFIAEVNGRELQAYVEPLRGGNHQVVGAIGLAIDSTERLVTERAIRISEQSYRSLIEESPSAILRATMSGQLLQVNRAMLEVLGYDNPSEQELLIRDLPLIFAPGGFDEFKRALSAQPVVHGIESTWLRRDGRPIQVRVSGRALRAEGDPASCIDVLAEDITEKKQLEAQLNHAQRMQAVGQLAGGVAHDFNNLLTVIIGHVEMLLGETSDPQLRDHLSPVKEAAERATVLTRQLLAFSRRQVFQSRIMDVNEVIRRFSRMLARLIKETVQLKLVLAPGESCIRADSQQIEQVLMNLAVNAQDAMPRGGILTIETANLHIDSPVPGIDLGTGAYVRIVVRDTGVGMDAPTQARVFEPFFTTKKVGEGTGLGLSMVYGIVRQSGGQILVESAPGAGATFTVYLPRVAEPAHETKEAVHGVSQRPRGQETILIAEDEEPVRKLIAGFLGDLGYQVLSAEDGHDALDLARTHPGKIHLLLSDIVMPGLGGRELAVDMKNMFPWIKIVFISGYVGHGASGSDLEMPDALFLPKPLSLDVLAQTVRSVLDGVPLTRSAGDSASN